MSLLLALTLGLGSAAPEAVEMPTRVDLAYKSFRTFSVELPAEAFQAVSGGIGLPKALGGPFAAETRADGLALDTDGDGVFDLTIAGSLDSATGVRSARATLQTRDALGQVGTYAVRLQDVGKGWTWACGGALVGLVGDTKISVFDLNGNGRYGEVGQDALTIGTSDTGLFLSKTVHVGGQLFELCFANDGASLELTPFSGATGTLNLESKLDSKGKLLAAIVQSQDGQNCFDLAGASAGRLVPAGTYRVLSGRLGLGKAVVNIDASGMQPVPVEADATRALAWGAPIQAEFDYELEGSKLTFLPEAVWLTGSAGERYVGWSPIGKSPEFTIVEKKLGTELEKALFPGSC